MNIFCVNINNTNTSFGMVREIRKRDGGYFPTAQLEDPENGLRAVLEKILRTDPKPAGLSLSSVVPAATRKFRRVVETSGWSLPIHQITPRNCPLPLNFPNPSEIGQDRLANAVGAKLLYPTPVIVIDMGTAVTFDIISSKGYEGGIIAPGLEVMTRYLHEETALLPKLDPNDLMVSAGIGKSTLEAMKLGCAVGMEGMIRALLERVLSELRVLGEGTATIVATGGSAGILPRTWLSDIAFNPDINLIGLAEAFRKSRH